MGGVAGVRCEVLGARGQGAAAKPPLSASQVGTYRRCPARWWFRYGLGMPEPMTGVLAVGIAVHEAIEQNYRDKLDTREDLADAAVMGLYRQAWSRLKRDTEFREDEAADEMGAIGEQLARKYVAEVAPLVEPQEVEMEVEGEIGGVRVRGKLDLLDTSGRIVDVKTACRRPNGIQPDYRFQTSTYVQITPGAVGDVRVDTLVKTKTPSIVEQSFRVTGADLQLTATVYPLAAEAMTTGLYVPNREDMRCSRRHCGYWRMCEREYGGEVKAS